MSETIEHKCSKCGASIVFNPDSQTMICPYCGTLSDVLDTISNDGNLRSKKKRKNANLTDEELQYISEYQCVSCGGEIYADDTTSATLCPYCGNAVILRGRVSGMLRPKKIIPFQISKEQALEGLDRFIGSKHFVHKDFIDRRKLDEVKGLYVPFWIFDAKASGDITYDCVNQRVWTQGDYEYTERKYYSVRRAGDLEFHDLPVTASSKMSDDMMESIEPYDVSMSTNFITGYLSGYIADRYDIEEESAFPRAEKRMFRSVQSELSATVHYDEVRISEKEMDMPWSRSRYVLYPVWMISSVWKDQVFTFAMNGQTGKFVGDLPMDKGLRNKYFAISFAIAGAVAAGLSYLLWLI